MSTYSHAAYLRQKPHRSKYHKTRLIKVLDSWKAHFSSITNCECCNTSISWNSGNIWTSIHFDHKTGNETITKQPTNWLRCHIYNEQSKAIFDSCNFGHLCRRCSTHIPTNDRKAWLNNVTKYINS